MRTVACSGGVFAERRRKQDGVHPLRQIVPVSELLRELVVDAAAQDKFNFVVRGQGLEIFLAKSSARARVRTLHVDDLDDPGWNPLQWPLPTSLEQDAVAVVEEMLHQGDNFALLQHGLAAGDLDQPAAGTQPRNFVENRFEGHLAPALEGVFAVAPGTSQIASGKTHEHASQSSK